HPRAHRPGPTEPAPRTLEVPARERRAHSAAADALAVERHGGEHVHLEPQTRPGRAQRGRGRPTQASEAKVVTEPHAPGAHARQQRVMAEVDAIVGADGQYAALTAPTCATESSNELHDSLKPLMSKDFVARPSRSPAALRARQRPVYVKQRALAVAARHRVDKRRRDAQTTGPRSLATRPWIRRFRGQYQVRRKSCPSGREAPRPQCGAAL